MIRHLPGVAVTTTYVPARVSHASRIELHLGSRPKQDTSRCCSNLTFQASTGCPEPKGKARTWCTVARSTHRLSIGLNVTALYAEVQASSYLQGSGALRERSALEEGRLASCGHNTSDYQNA